MHILFLNHEAEDEAVAEAGKVLEPRGFEQVENAADADLAVVLVSAPYSRSHCPMGGRRSRRE